MKRPYFIAIFLIIPIFITGFTLDNAIVPKDEILAGGPPKDGIPALLEPKFVSAERADFLSPEDQVIGVLLYGQPMAYPTKILNWHEVVNDTVGDMPIVVTFWPLTQTGVVYSGKIDDTIFTFGVSGRLYKSNVLIYDHQTESLWSQLKETAIAGPMVGKKLIKISAQRTTWKRWLIKHPQTKVLSTDTGYARNYNLDPYENYYRALGIMFPVGDVRKDLPAKEKVLGIEINGDAKAYPLSLFEQKAGKLKDKIGENPVQIVISEEGQVVNVLDRQGQTIPVIFAYWFAWQAFHPETEVYVSAK